MPALIPGYNYDIFVSYRQKDNKGDRWVSEFVDALKTELESTFKEEISVYFDINPHDGLLETHDVDASLKDKLKCLIFIPIISRTYCDPKSFAWIHEFKAFLEQASQDRFGLKIKLPGGNVASRILPVKIHDLDPEDKILLESEMRGVLRPLEFIYKSSGVNRPLKPDDSRTENMNHTYYRDQINKVAIAVKEIITGLKNFNNQENILFSEKISSNNVPREVKAKRSKLKIAVWTFIILGLIVSGYFLWASFFENSSKSIDRSIAVLPFENMSNDPEQEYFSDGMMQEILNHLYKIGELQVTARTSSMKFKKSKKSIREIAGELKVSYVLEGNVRKYGNNLRINTQLISVKNNQRVVWSEDYNREITIANILDIQSEVAEQVALKLKAKINPEVRRNIESHATNSKIAYDWYLKGLKKIDLYWASYTIGYVDSAMQYFLKAIEQDPRFSMPYIRLGSCYWLLAEYSPNPSVTYWLESERALKKAIELDPYNGEAYANHAVVQYGWKWDREGAEKSIEKAIQLMPGDLDVRTQAFYFFIRSGKCERARQELKQLYILDPKAWDAAEVWLELCEGKAGRNEKLLENVLKSTSFDSLTFLNLYIIEKQYDKANEMAEKWMKKNDVHNLWYLTFYGVGAALAGDTNKAITVINKLKEISVYRSVPNIFFAMIYFALGNEGDSYGYLEKALANREWLVHILTDLAPFYDHREDPKLLKIIERSWIPLSANKSQN